MCGALDCGRCGLSDEDLRDYMEDEEEPEPEPTTDIGDPNIPDRLDKLRGEYLNEPPF
tara:strand:- start:677 stop:850 length:174 start_codon:yes stop_codon:yes gene_type:complete